MATGGLASETGPEDSIFGNQDLMLMMMEGKSSTMMVNEDDENSPFL